MTQFYLIYISIFFLHSEEDALDLYHASWSSTHFHDLIDKLQHGVDPNHQIRNYDGFTPLHQACHHNNPVSVQSLIEWGANIEAVHRYNGYTPLHNACSMGSTGAIEKLLQHCPNTGEYK